LPVPRRQIPNEQSRLGLDAYDGPLGREPLYHPEAGIARRQPLMSGDARRLRIWLGILGGINAACLAAHVVLSYGLTTLAPFGQVQEHEAESFRRLALSLAFLGRDVQAFVTGQSVLSRAEAFLAASSLPLLSSTAVFVALLALLARHRQELDANAPRLLFRWAVAFAVLSAFASPVLVQDFWLSAGWGRIVADGLNPYYVRLTPEFARGLPLDGFDVEPATRMRMTYGPLWAVVSGVVMGLVGERVWLAAALFKALLAGAWIACLRLIWLSLRDRSAWSQCAGLAIFGWVPLSVTQTVAEGHNDVFLVLFLCLWLYALERSRPVWASLSLAASVLVKYVSAPLFLLDLLHLRHSRKKRLADYLLPLAAAAALLSLTFGLFLRSPEFFTPAVSMQDWRFYTLSDAVIGLGKLAGITDFNAFPGPLFVALALLARALFPFLAVYTLVRYMRWPTAERFRETVLALMAAILFGVLGHLWPWFLLWALGAAAMVPGSPLTRWVVGVALAAPFPILAWTVFPEADPFTVPTVALYAFALLWFGFAPRGWWAAEPARSA
jgi:hypothetical protein